MDPIPIFRVQAVMAVLLLLLLLVDSVSPIPVVELQTIQTNDLRPLPKEVSITSDGSSTRMMSSLVQKAKHTVWKLGPNQGSTSTTTAAIKSEFGCFTCRMIAKAAHLIIRSGATEDEVGRWGTAICTKFNLFTARECFGICELMKKEVVFVFSQTSIDPRGTCSSILDKDCGASTDQEWNVTLPDVQKPKVEPVPSAKPNAKRLRVLHLSDVHLDVEYVAGSNADCGEMLCCRDGAGGMWPHPAGPFGMYNGCDTPLSTIESLLTHAAETNEVDLVVWTGDDSPHDDWKQTTDSHLKVLDKMTELLEKHFPSTPVFATVGNHEGNPVNSFPLPFAASVASMDWLYGALNRAWSRWIPTGSQSTASDTILRGGFYSIPVFPGFRIISLNMNYCNSLNWWLLLNTTDPLGQLHWLAEELQAAESSNEKVYIIGHIPPGCNDCLPAWSANYYRIIDRYEGTVRAQFFGHTHMDDFEVFYDASATPPRPTNVAYISPSVTPYDGGNPAYRIYTIDGDHPESTWAVLNHETYYVNLTEANLMNELKWVLLYDAKDAYKMDSLQPADWNELIDRLEKDDALFGLFYRHYHRESDGYPACTTAQCRRSLICKMRSARSGNHGVC